MNVLWQKQRSRWENSMNNIELEQYFVEHNYPTYERSNYDKFLLDQKYEFNLPCIHVTGTNGKGSTSNYIANIYRKAGLKVGLYTSPYLDDVTEMVFINGRQVLFEQYLAKFEEWQTLFEKYHLSTFEMQTIVAFELLKEAKVDIAIIEVGMGGYIDATNIINPLLSIITSVSLEHTTYLGGTTSEIAYSKAGIIKKNTPVLLGKMDEFALYAIRETAKKLEAPVHIVSEYFNEQILDGVACFNSQKLKNVRLSVPVLYQVKNACLAIDAVKLLEEHFKVDDEIIKLGLQESCLPCRFEYINEHILIDGAHNPEAMQSLVDSLKASVYKPIHVIFASFRDKNFSQMLNILDTVSTDITITTFDHKRAKKEEEYFLFLSTYKFEEDYLKKVKELIETYPDDLILIAGSLCFAGLVKRQLKK